MTDVIDYVNPRMWPFSDQKVLVIAKASVYGGLNLRKPFSVTIHDPGKSIDIRLPRPEVIAVDPTYRYYDIQGSPPPDVQTYVLNQAKYTLRSAALQAGILDDTRKSLRAQLVELFPDYQVNVTFDDDRPIPPTPRPLGLTTRSSEQAGR